MSVTSSQQTSQSVGNGTVGAYPQWARPVAAFLLLAAIIWLAMYAAYAAFTFVRPGSTIIADAKFEQLVRGRMFDDRDRVRVLVFGHSKALTCVRPRDLDAAMGEGFRSYNLGLPGEVQFLPILEAALAAGNIPTHVLLMLPWDARDSEKTAMDFLRDDPAIARVVVPFRSFPRDLTLFAFENRARLSDAVRDVDIQRNAMIGERGWYFIKSQSHFDNDRLPDDYVLPTDRPNEIATRVIPERSLVRAKLEQLAIRHGFKIVFIPYAYRYNEYALNPSAGRHDLRSLSGAPSIRVAGPDYISYPPSHFADPHHMNERGASAYTADLADLLKSSGALD